LVDYAAKFKTTLNSLYGNSLRLIKNLIRGGLAKLGFQISKVDGQDVRFGAFVNLAKAYEAQLSQASGTEFSQNDGRYRLLAKLQGTPPTEAYSILEALTRCQSLDGDVCEFGVAEGDTSALIANEIIATGKKLHLFDSFEGLPKPTEKDQLIDDIFKLGSMDAYEGKMSFPEASVRKRLQLIGFPESRTFIHKGFIEKTISESELLPKKVSVAYVDFDFYEPIIEALNFLESVLEIGGIVIVDDYGFFSSGAKLAVDEWILLKNSADILYSTTVADELNGKYIILEKIK
jgi:O-methyltransferase